MSIIFTRKNRAGLLYKNKWSISLYQTQSMAVNTILAVRKQMDLFNSKKKKLCTICYTVVVHLIKSQIYGGVHSFNSKTKTK